MDSDKNSLHREEEHQWTCPERVFGHFLVPACLFLLCILSWTNTLLAVYAPPSPSVRRVYFTPLNRFDEKGIPIRTDDRPSFWQYDGAVVNEDAALPPPSVCAVQAFMSGFSGNVVRNVHDEIGNSVYCRTFHSIRPARLHQQDHFCTRLHMNACQASNVTDASWHG